MEKYAQRILHYLQWQTVLNNQIIYNVSLLRLQRVSTQDGVFGLSWWLPRGHV